MEPKPPNELSAPLLVSMIAEFVKTAEVVDRLASEYNPDMFGEDTLKTCMDIARSLIASCFVSFGVEPRGNFGDLMVSYAKALMVLGRRSGTLSFVVANEDEEQS